MNETYTGPKAFFTPVKDIKVEDPDRDKYIKPYSRDDTPPPTGSCPYVGNKPFYATNLRVCRTGCTCTPQEYTDPNIYTNCPIYKHTNRLDGVLQK